MNEVKNISWHRRDGIEKVELSVPYSKMSRRLGVNNTVIVHNEKTRNSPTLYIVSLLLNN